ncbi:MAG: RIP metalloprotease RseP, partial [Methylotenera sp.]|nr:RIP metalloprotease RseP [Methylotenera sp.]
IGAVVTIHEFGHYQVARWCGVKILQFSIGMGKPLWKKKLGKDQTEYVIAMLPIGGFVRMLDEREMLNKGITLEVSEVARAYNRQSVWKRMAIAFAGPMANFVFAMLLFWIVFMMGILNMKPMIGEVTKDSPAYQAHFEKGDLVKSVAGKKIDSWQDMRWELLDYSLEKHPIPVEVINQEKVSQTRLLLLSGLDKNDVDADIMEKIGLGMERPIILPRIGKIVEGSAAEKAGLKTKDMVQSVNGKAISDWESFVKIVQASPEQPLKILVRRDVDQLELTVTPEAETVKTKTGEVVQGRIGVAFRVEQFEIDQVFTKTRYSPLESLVKAAEKTWATITLTLKMLGGILTGELSWKGLSGPVSIAGFAAQSAGMGMVIFMSFLAFISVSIGVFNLLPVPVLDGGHLMYHIVEILKGSPVSERTMMFGQRIGLGLLGLLFCVAFFNDMVRLVT